MALSPKRQNNSLGLPRSVNVSKSDELRRVVERLVETVARWNGEHNPCDRVVQICELRDVLVEVTDGGNVAAVRWKGDGTIITADGVSEVERIGVGKYVATLSAPAELDSEGNWKLTAVATPGASLDEDGAGGEEETLAFSDDIARASDGSVSDIQWFFSEPENKIYVLGHNTDTIYVHDLDDFEAGPDEIDAGTILDPTSTGSGCISREGTHLYLNGDASAGVRCVILATGEVRDFGTSSDFRVVAAYNDGTDECVLIRDGSALRKYKPDLSGSPSLGSTVASWSVDPFQVACPYGAWDSAGNVWFAGASKIYMVNPAVDVAFRQHTYTVGGTAEAPLTYDSTRNRFYVQVNTGVAHTLYTFHSWSTSADDTGQFTQFKPLVQPLALHFDAESDLLVTVGGPDERKLVRYVAETADVLDETSVLNTSGPDNDEVDRNLVGRQIYYADDLAWIYAAGGGGVADGITRVRFRGQSIHYYDGGLVSTAVAAGPCAWTSSTNEIWLMDIQYENVGGGVFRFRLGIFDIEDETWSFLVPTHDGSAYAGGVSRAPHFYVIDEWDMILIQGATLGALIGGYSSHNAYRISTREHLGNYGEEAEAIAPSEFTFSAKVWAIDPDNNRAVISDSDASVNVFELDSTTHLPSSLLGSQTIAGSRLYVHPDKDGNWWALTTNGSGTWYKIAPTGGSQTSFSCGADGALIGDHSYAYDPLRHCFYYWGSAGVGDWLMKIDCDTGAVSRVREFTGDNHGLFVRRPFRFDVDSDRLFIVNGGTAGPFGICSLNVDTGAYLEYEVHDASGAHFAYPEFAISGTEDSVWAPAIGIGGDSDFHGIGRLRFDRILGLAGGGGEEDTGFYGANVRILSANEVQINVFLIDAPCALADHQCNLHVAYT